MERDLTIGYVTIDDPNDRRSWSGIHNFLLVALRKRVARVVPIGPLRPQPELFLSRAFNQVLLRVFKKRFNYRASWIMARAYARVIKRRTKGLDLIIAPAGLPTVTLIDPGVPIIYFNDRCTAGAMHYHRILWDLAEFSRKESLAVEHRTFQNSDLVVFSSDWAAEGARKAYPDIADKLRVIPMGANLDAAPAPPEPRKFPPERLKLLMLGVNWVDKGGPIAYEALQELKRNGHAAQLVVVGCTPPPGFDDADLVREGFLNKNVPADMAKLVEHLRTADFLILPTRFEAYGIVFCEAAAYGLPVLATRTGGIPTVVQDGRTGFLFDAEEGGGAYAKRVMEMIKEPQRWHDMRLAARARYEGILNWEAFVQNLLDHAPLPRRRSR